MSKVSTAHDADVSELERAIADVLKEGSFGTTDLNEAIAEAQTELDGIKKFVSAASLHSADSSARLHQLHK